MDPTAAQRCPDHGAFQGIPTQAGGERTGTGLALPVGGPEQQVRLQLTITETPMEQRWGLQDRRSQLQVSEF
jgi:hypothetical protein